MKTSAARRARNPRGSGERLRDEIVVAALELVDETGSADAVTLRAVARGAGITAPSIYAHFADRDAVVEAVVVASFAQLREVTEAALAGLDDPVERLHAGCRAYLRFAAEHPQRYRVLFGGKGPMAHNVPVLSRAEFAAVPGADTFGVLVDAIAECVAAGRSTSTDPFFDAAAIWAEMHGYASLRAGLPMFPWPADDEFVDSFVNRLGRVN